MALTAGQIPVLANVPNSDVAVLNSAGTGQGAGLLGTDTNGVTGYTAGALGGRVYSVLASTSALVNSAFVYILRGTKVIPIGNVSIPATSGNTVGSTVKNVDFLDGVALAGLPVDNTGKRYIPLQGGDLLRFSVWTAIPTGATRTYITSLGADYQL